MPLEDGRTPTNSELDKRLKLLESSKISVKQLPMAELRKALAKEPQNPADLLLPHSIGPDLLKEEGKLKYVAKEMPINQTCSFVTAEIVPFSNLTIPTAGIWIAIATGDFISGASIPILRFANYPANVIKSHQHVFAANFRNGLAMSMGPTFWNAEEQLAIQQGQTGAGTCTYVDVLITALKIA